MLFTIVIDVLNSVILRAVQTGILHRLTPNHMASSISLYADDVVVFCHPDRHDLATVQELLSVFGGASGLRTNFDKCYATPIQCSPAHEATIGLELDCPVKHFPMTYLGLLLSVRRIHSSHLMLLVDRMRKKLSTWRASLLTRGERLALVRHVLRAMPGHLLAAIALNAHVLKLVNRLVREFLWHGRKDSASGHCAVN
ncbi:uncharacterized protein [Aegilops tauschii subsp. strangulata]|uniref:uncharacterized protein n=1 Tax=Aegilops tauschii subsp. strangulata TaxID=200361 RepID=UPI003CC8719B